MGNNIIIIHGYFLLFILSLHEGAETVIRYLSIQIHYHISIELI